MRVLCDFSDSERFTFAFHCLFLPLLDIFLLYSWLLLKRYGKFMVTSVRMWYGMIWYDTVFFPVPELCYIRLQVLILHKDYPHKIFGDKRVSYVL